MSANYPRRKPREPGDFTGLGRIGDCAKCGARLPLVKKKTKKGVVYVSRHLCLECDPEGSRER